MVKDRIGVGRFTHAAKRAFVQAAANEAFPSGSKINLSRLAVITGLTRKEVSVLAGRAGGKRKHPTRRSNEQRAFRVVRGWRMDPRFQDTKGQPAVLPLRGAHRTFATLVKEYARDVTPMSVLSELERLNIVSLVQSKTRLRLLSRRVQSHSQGSQNLSELARLLGDFVATINQKESAKVAPNYFAFKDSMLSSPDQAARFQRVFSNRAAALIESFEQWLGAQARDVKSTRSRAQSRVGLGVYLVHDAAPGAAKKRNGGLRRSKGFTS